MPSKQQKIAMRKNLRTKMVVKTVKMKKHCYQEDYNAS
ncbi:hypothetical protein Taro_000044 [Colocasia esculenta]|uniref:Uncharacterized protein n=1 Tax=Colocasia esculenta TaxID=4460 RepID=A0A843TFJ7_COLES|nr:hypothetical protein [Colocasia esculenta]